MTDEVMGQFLRNMLGTAPPRPGPPWTHTITAPDPEVHSDPHFAGSLCVCGCGDCTLRLIRQCVCPDCPCEGPEDHAPLVNWS